MYRSAVISSDIQLIPCLHYVYWKKEEDTRRAIATTATTTTTKINSTSMETVFDTIKQQVQGVNTPRVDRFVERIRENAPQFVESIRNNLRVGPVEGDYEQEIQNDLHGEHLHDDDMATAVAAAVAAKARMEDENRLKRRPLRRMVRNLRQQCPEDIRGAVQQLIHREQPLDYEDCDSNGRPVASGFYSNALNEQEEPRDQPPSCSTPTSTNRERVQRVMSAIRRSQTPQEAFQKARSAATSTTNQPAYYVNFNDEEGASSYEKRSSYSAPLHTPTKTKKSSTMGNTEYAEMDDNPWKSQQQQQQRQQEEEHQQQVEEPEPEVSRTPTKKPNNGMMMNSPLHATAHYHWGAPSKMEQKESCLPQHVTEEEEDDDDEVAQEEDTVCKPTRTNSCEEDSTTSTGSTCSESEHPVTEEESTSADYNSNTMLHSTAKYHWGAISSSTAAVASNAPTSPALQ